MNRTIRSTSFGDLKRCIRRAYYRYTCGYTIKSDAVNPDLFFGTLVHEARKILHGEGLEKALEYIDKHDFPPHKIKNKNAAKVLMKVYAKKRKAKTMTDERSFSFAIGDWTWKGRFDGICTYASKMYVSEAKTTNPFFLQTNPNDQFISYLIGARSEFSDNIAGILLDNFDVEKLDVRFYELTFSKRDIDEWLAETKAWLKFYDVCMEENVFPKSPDGCSMYGPMRRCIYHPLCTAADSETAERIVKGLYTVNEKQRQQEW